METIVDSPGLTTVVKDDDSISIYIVGEINEEVSNDTISTLLQEDLDEIKDVKIYITSQGGYLAHCFAIIDFLLYIKHKYKLTLETYALGEIASAGFFIFIVGDIRTIFPSCRVFVHSHITIGDECTYEERLKADKTEEKEIYDNYIKYTAEQLDLSILRAKRLLKKRKWLNHKEILDYNLIKDSKIEQHT